MMMPLGMERVGDNSARNTIAGVVGSADCHNRDFRKAAAHDRKEFESRHFRHVEIGDNDVRGRPFHLQKSIEAIVCGNNVISHRRQQQSRAFPNVRLVVYNKDQAL